MAKAKTEKKVDPKLTAKSAAILRKGALAYIGLYGAAYERAKTRIETARSSTDGVFDKLVARGETLESQALNLAKGARVKATETVNTSKTKVRNILPTASNDRVEELEAEVTKLNKKISAMAKKAANTKKVKVTTQKVAKPATGKAA